MSHPELTLTDPFTKGLACAAIATGLRSILIFDAPYTDLKTTANRLAQMLECVTVKTVKKVSLGVSELDDDLWGSVVISKDDTNVPVVWYNGALSNLLNTSQENGHSLLLVIIPDLTKLSLAASRACVMLIGAEVTHLERYGQDETWQPDICWLANCPKTHIGAISPHLLDRFALRLNWPGSHQSYTVSDLLIQILNEERPVDLIEVPLPSSLTDPIRKAAKLLPSPTYDAMTRVLDYTPVTGPLRLRREIALARLARTVAQIEEENQVAASHVDAAARLMGLVPAIQSLDEQKESQADQPLTMDLEDSSTELEPSSSNSVVKNFDVHSYEAETTYIMEPIYEPNQSMVVDNVMLPTDPYPEDGAPIEREFASLRLPLLRQNRATSGRGVVIGVQRANDLRDLALVNTLLAAAPFQPIRHKYRQMDNHRLLLSAADLRCYRRESGLEQLLLILLDYTSLHDCDWMQALLPYLRWAYIERASIGIVQVGMANPAHEYRAELVNAHSILVSSIATSLEEKRGRATPLAHGFDLALRALRHALQQGSSTLMHALLVVISDGRGNVPLETSLNAGVTWPISREGIEDALRVAQHISNLKNVQTVLLNPRPKYYSDLPLALANALGAQIVNIQQGEGVVEGGL